MIKGISIERINPHPDNPRKDLGDLTELIGSIKTFGVLQNLTVVPSSNDDYKVVCGHRRLAAAKAAGLMTLPCAVADEMDHKTQISVMLLENMQRSDLTVQEEAQGFQMMLDLGSSIADIVEETGLSETKVRHRVKLNELDQDLLTEKMAKNISINDLIKLEKIKDHELKNQVLKEIGTNNFEWKLKEAIDKEKRIHFMSIANAIIPGCDEVDYRWDYREIETINADADDEQIVRFAQGLKEAAEKEGVDLGIYFSSGMAKGFLCVVDNQRYAEDPEEAKERAERHERKKSLQEMLDKIYGMWDDHIRSITEAKAKELHRELIGWAVIDAMCLSYINTEMDDILVIMDIDIPVEGTNNQEEVDKEVRDILMDIQSREPYRLLLIGTYLALKPSSYTNTWSWSNEYEKDETISTMQDFMSAVGYDESDDEAAFLAGESDLYAKEEE